MTLKRFDSLIESGKAEFAKGLLEPALDSFEGAEAVARELGRLDLEDRAFCSRCCVLVELEEVGPQIPKLQQVLLRSTDPKTAWMAAYYTAVAFYLDDERDRAFGFARRALDLASRFDEPETLAASANQLGNLALLNCEFSEAEDAYRKAFEAYAGLDGYRRLARAQVEDNLGYTLMCTERVRAGIEHCEHSRDEMAELEASHFIQQPLQDLCYGYLLDGRLEEAMTSGEEGLEYALAVDDRSVVKNLLFLLADVSVRQGNRFRARRFLSELSSYYPGVAPSEEMIDVLLAVDLTQVVNLRS